MVSEKIKFIQDDNYNTPVEGWKDIMQFIENKNSKIWLPFYNDGSAKKILLDLGFKNIYHENIDFFTYTLEDYILIDNPPYSIKEKIIKRLYDMKISFSLLLPIDTLERKYFVKYTENLQLVIPKIRYIYKEGAKNPPFKSCWFCWNMKEYLPNKQLIFL